MVYLDVTLDLLCHSNDVRKHQTASVKSVIVNAYQVIFLSKPVYHRAEICLVVTGRSRQQHQRFAIFTSHFIKLHYICPPKNPFQPCTHVQRRLPSIIHILRICDNSRSIKNTAFVLVISSLELFYMISNILHQSGIYRFFVIQFLEFLIKYVKRVSAFHVLILP